MEIPEWPVEFIKVEKEDYPRNDKASYCTRPPEMIDTVVIHHSETSEKATPQEINTIHLNRGTTSDPWYMIAYSFVINSSYPGNKQPEAKLTEGRPLNVVGAHAGSGAFVTMDEDQQKMWDEGKIVCGKTGGPFAVDLKQVKNGKIKANVTTIGVVVSGNYAAFGRFNPNGYSWSKPRHPTQSTLEMAAKMSCQLQKKYPKIKYIKWHSLYNATTCPGNLRLHIEKIKKIAKGYGCDFK